MDTGLGAGEDYAAAVADEDLLDPSTWTWTPSDRLFLDFLRTCKSKGLRVVLDAVFNHVGVAHPAFQDVQENREGSRYASPLHGTRAAISFSTAGRLPPVLVQGPVQIHRTTEELCDPRATLCLPPDGRGCGSNGHRAWRCALCSRCTPLAPPPTVLAFSHASEHAVMMLTRA